MTNKVLHLTALICRQQAVVVPTMNTTLQRNPIVILSTQSIIIILLNGLVSIIVQPELYVIKPIITGY